MGGFRIPRAPQYASNPNKYVLGGRIHIETGLLVVIFFSCFREILEIIMTSQEKLYVIDIEFFTALFYDIMNITVMVGVIWTAIYKNPIFLLPYILMQMLFVFIWGMHFVLYFARAIIPSLPENPLLYTDDRKFD
uniref:Transmembrane protein n=1 Tax=Rhabditophanes sp. KR3021 TaxID=114890 RepID=A0AC35TWL1_9BILA